MKKPPAKRTPGMRAEYDFSGGVRGKYVERYRSGTNVSRLDPELAEAFPDSKSVNDALGLPSRSQPEPNAVNVPEWAQRSRSALCSASSVFARNGDYREQVSIAWPD